MAQNSQLKSRLAGSGIPVKFFGRDKGALELFWHKLFWKKRSSRKQLISRKLNYSSSSPLVFVCLTIVSVMLGIFSSGMSVQAATPDQVTGLAFWLKADAGVTQVNGVVSAWADQSGYNNNNAVQATESAKPVLVSSAIGGKPAIRFDGVDDKFTFSQVMAQTFFVVYKDGGTTSDYADILGHSTAGVFGGDTVASGKLISSLYAYPEVVNGTAFQDGTSIAPTSLLVSTNYHAYAFLATGSVPINMLMNNQNQANRYRKGDIAEVIAYTGLIGTADRVAIENYLGNKYSLGINQFTPGTISVTGRTATTVNLSATEAIGGTAPYSHQWYRSTTANFYPTSSTAIAGATGLTLAETGLTATQTYYYKLVYTDIGLKSATTIQTIISPTPDQISGLNFWLKADAGVTQSANKVSVWADQSASANNATQLTAANQPTYVANTLNGKPVIRFTGAPVKMGFNAVSAQTVFVVYKDNGTTDDYADILGNHLGISDFGGDTAASGKLISPTYAAAKVTGGQGYVDGAAVAPASMTRAAAYHIYSFVPTAAASFANIANNQDQTNRFLKGDYAEIVSYSGALSAQNRFAVEGYLAQKYNLSVVQSQPATSLKVYADGDSVTAYTGNYTGNYKTDIEASVPNTIVTTTNVAVSGQSLSQMLSDLQTQILAQNPDIITLSTFLNDMGANPATLDADITSYVNQVLAHKNPTTGLPPQLILMTDNLSGQNLAELWARPYETQVDTANRVMTIFNRYVNNPNVHVVNNFASFDALGGPGNPDTAALYAKLLTDKVHPNAAGYDIFRSNLQAPMTAAATRVFNSTIVNGELSVASPGAGTYNTARSVSLSFPLYASQTFYTLDGSAPNNTKTQYTGGVISIDAADGVTKTLKVASYDAAGTLGSVFTANYFFDKLGPLAPTVSPATGTYNVSQSVTLTPPGDAISTYYSLDGSVPDNTKTLYTGSFSVSGADGATVLLRAVSYDAVGNIGSALSASYVFDKTGPTIPAASPAGSTYGAAQSVTLTTAPDAANTYYTLDGTTPDNTKTVYAGPIAIDGADGVTKVLKVISYDTVGNPSAIFTANYIFDKSAPVVTGVTDGSTYNVDKIITFDKGTATLDGLAFASGSTVTTESAHILVVTGVGGTTTIHFTINKTVSPVSKLIDKIQGVVAALNSAKPTNSTEVQAETQTEITLVISDIKANDRLLLAETNFELGKPIIFSGLTKPLATVHLYFHSDPFEATVQANQDGNWRYELTRDLGQGEHTLQIAISDSKNNGLSSKTEPAKFFLVSATQDNPGINMGSFLKKYGWLVCLGSLILLAIFSSILLRAHRINRK